jgi:hypothetical protein
MGRRSYSGEKWRKEQARKAKRDAKQEKKQQGRAEGDGGGGPPIDWDSMVGGPGTPPEAGAEDQSQDQGSRPMP